MKGTVVQFVEYNSRIYKVVYEKDDIFWLISFENPAAPFPASKENLILQEMPAEYMDETPASAKRNTTMEKRLKILDEMVYPDSFTARLYAGCADADETDSPVAFVRTSVKRDFPEIPPTKPLKKLVYVDEDIAEKRTWKGAHFPEHREDEN